MASRDRGQSLFSLSDLPGIDFAENVLKRWLILHPSSFGALTQLYAGTMEEGANLNGKVSTNSIIGSANGQSP